MWKFMNIYKNPGLPRATNCTCSPLIASGGIERPTGVIKYQGTSSWSLSASWKESEWNHACMHASVNARSIILFQEVASKDSIFFSCPHDIVALMIGSSPAFRIDVQERVSEMKKKKRNFNERTSEERVSINWLMNYQNVVNVFVCCRCFFFSF